MQIRTALAIGSGITIGVIFGMGISEDTKCRILGKARKTLIHALGGEEKKNYTTFRNPSYHRTYASYAKYYANEKSNSETKTDNDKELDPIKYEDLLTFNDYALAQEFLDTIKDFVNECDGPMSVFDLYHIRNKHIDYTWDAYGWDKKTVLSSLIVGTYDYDSTSENGSSAKCVYKISIGKPKLLKEE